MMKELINAGAWNKTSRLIFDKYGKRIEFRFLTVIQSEQPYYSNGDDLVIPLNTRDQYLGEVIIHRGANLSINAKMEVADLIHFLVEPFAYNLHLKEITHQLEDSQTESLKQASENLREVPTNVISLFKTSEVYNLDTTTESSAETSTRKTISSILHLHSKSPTLRHKVAMKMHELLKSNFFVQLSDISKTLHSISDLSTLEGATIYVDHILQLNSYEIQLLADFAKASHTANVQFLIGSDLTEKEIMSLPCGEQLKKDLIGFLFEIDKVPVSQQTSRDVLELLFFSLEDTIS